MTLEEKESLKQEILEEVFESLQGYETPEVEKKRHSMPFLGKEIFLLTSDRGDPLIIMFITFIEHFETINKSGLSFLKKLIEKNFTFADSKLHAQIENILKGKD